MTMIAIRERVAAECENGANALGPAFFDQHLKVVAEYAGMLAEVLGGDLEIVALAAWLHDIAAVRDIATLPEHPALSAEITRQMLQEDRYDSTQIDRVAQCIRSHSSPIPVGGGTVEEVCLSNADAMSQIVRPVYWLYFAFDVRKLDFATGRQWLRDRVEKNWAELIPAAKPFVDDAYGRTREFLASF